MKDEENGLIDYKTRLTDQASKLDALFELFHRRIFEHGYPDPADLAHTLRTQKQFRDTVTTLHKINALSPKDTP